MNTTRVLYLEFRRGFITRSLSVLGVDFPVIYLGRAVTTVVLEVICDLFRRRGFRHYTLVTHNLLPRAA